MQVCDDCGACREPEWRVCPFCRAELGTPDAVRSSQSNGFDALAAVAERTEGEVLPSPVPTIDESTVEIGDELLTEDDLAHLTGAVGPDATGWASPSSTESDGTTEADGDDGVSRAVIIPLIAAAAVAVVFVAYSIVTQSPAQRPDPVALIDRTTTTRPMPTTTETTMPFDGAVPIGIDIAEQAERMCRGDQFSIARSGEPSTAIYNDVMVAVQDGRSDWAASPDQAMLRGPVPPLVGCLRTADAGEIDRCPNTATIISRRAVSWSYRVLRTLDGLAVGSDAGTANEVRPCDQLEIEAAGSDYGSWSPLPTDRFAAAAADFTTAPHPQQACATLVTDPPTDLDRQTDLDPPTDPSEEAGAAEPPEPASPIEPGLALHATAYNTPDVDHPLPDGWAAADERPVEAVLCLIETGDLDRIELGADGDTDPTTDGTLDEADRPVDDPVAEEPPVQVPPVGCPISVVAMLRSGERIGSWEYGAETCPREGDALVPVSWLAEEIGPELGYPLDDGSPPSDGVVDGE